MQPVLIRLNVFHVSLIEILFTYIVSSLTIRLIEQQPGFMNSVWPNLFGQMFYYISRHDTILTSQIFVSTFTCNSYKLYIKVIQVNIGWCNNYNYSKGIRKTKIENVVANLLASIKC